MFCLFSHLSFNQSESWWAYFLTAYTYLVDILYYIIASSNTCCTYVYTFILCGEHSFFHAEEKTTAVSCLMSAGQMRQRAKMSQSWSLLGNTEKYPPFAGLQGRQPLTTLLVMVAAQRHEEKKPESPQMARELQSLGAAGITPITASIATIGLKIYILFFF